MNTIPFVSSHFDSSITIRHQRSRRLKRIHLRIEDSTTVLVKTPPHCTHRQIESILRTQQQWIANELVRKQMVEHNRATHPKLFYLGKAYRLLEGSQATSPLTIQGGIAHLSSHQEDKKSILHAFYLQQAQNLLPRLLTHHANRMNLLTPPHRLRKTKTRWGSCNRHNVIMFNTRLLLMPLPLIEYVVIHELCHLEHKHHGVSFKSALQHHLPDFRLREKKIRRFEREILPLSPY